MANVQTRQGQPRPYVFRSIQTESGHFVQHAIVTCDFCQQKAQFPYNKKENPSLIAEKFTRMGWSVYRGGQATCPECKKPQEKAAMPSPTVSPAVLKAVEDAPKPNGLATHQPPVIPAAAARTFLLTIAADGTPTMREVVGKEMIWDDKTYICVPIG